MKSKTRGEFQQLEMASYYIDMAKRCLYEAGEPALAGAAGSVAARINQEMAVNIQVGIDNEEALR